MNVNEHDLLYLFVGASLLRLIMNPVKRDSHQRRSRFRGFQFTKIHKTINTEHFEFKIL